MLEWLLFFLFLAVVAALFGFGGMIGAALFAQILFVVFLTLVALSFLFGRRATTN